MDDMGAPSANRASRSGPSDRQEPIRITTAPVGADVDVASRQRRYLFSMAVRTVCFLGAVLVGPGVLRWVLVAGAVLLPYVAVVIANNVQRREDPQTLPPVNVYRRELPGDGDAD
jgi:Protein of unknown function (DUF3099)